MLGKQMLWDWFKVNLERVFESIGEGLGGSAQMVSLVLNGLSTREQWVDATNFFEKKDTEVGCEF